MRIQNSEFGSQNAGRGLAVGRVGDPADRKAKIQSSISNIQYPISKGNSRGSEQPGRLGETTLPPIGPAEGRDAAPPASGFRVRSAGFTLIEVLAAMAVLVILVLALTRMFVEASSITKRGTTMLMRNSTGSTAMETLLQDAEGMIVNERLACYVEANAFDPAGFGFDDVWFISTSGDQDDDFPYEYFHYYVTNDISTNAAGAAYVRFNLMKERMIFAVADDDARRRRFYALDPADTRWWLKAKQNPQVGFAPWDRQVLAENVVRFDIYCTGWDGTGWMSSSPDQRDLWVFDSTLPHMVRVNNNNYSISNVPPAAFDIYVQITSPEAAVEGGMALMPNVDPAVQVKGRELMIRDSMSQFGRAVPTVGAASYNRVTVYGTKNTAYYYEEE